jgi:hypothetical protein
MVSIKPSGIKPSGIKPSGIKMGHDLKKPRAARTPVMQKRRRYPNVTFVRVVAEFSNLVIMDLP